MRLTSVADGCFAVQAHKQFCGSNADAAVVTGHFADAATLSFEYLQPVQVAPAHMVLASPAAAPACVSCSKHSHRQAVAHLAATVAAAVAARTLATPAIRTMCVWPVGLWGRWRAQVRQRGCLFITSVGRAAMCRCSLWLARSITCFSLVC